MSMKEIQGLSVRWPAAWVGRAVARRVQPRFAQESASGATQKPVPDTAGGATRDAKDNMAYRRADQSGLAYWWRKDAPLLPEPGPSRQLQLRAKRFTDVCLAVALIVLFGPLLVVSALIIKFGSPGPVLFRQMREGLDGRAFEIYKFRSMRTDACDASGVTQTRPGDARVTGFGRMMRRTSIDELPQLFNVLMGSMSLVGPRPHVKGMLAGGTTYEDLVPYYTLRHAMKPGLTGWAQANGLRGVTDDAIDARARIDHDIAYIQNFSLWLDIRCMGRTLLREFVTGSGV